MRSSITRLAEIDEHGVGWLFIEGAGPLNLVQSSVAKSVTIAARDLAESYKLRAVVVLSDSPHAFVGGADLREMASVRGSQQARDFIAPLYEMCEAIRDLPVPTVFAISGWCIGNRLGARCSLRFTDRCRRCQVLDA